MKHDVEEFEAQETFFARPLTGQLMTIASGLSFLFLLMILPIVGKAGVETVHYRQNLTAFSVVLAVSLLLAVLAAVSKMARRKIDNSPLPHFSFLLIALCLLLAGALVTGLLHI